MVCRTAILAILLSAFGFMLTAQENGEQWFSLKKNENPATGSVTATEDTLLLEATFEQGTFQTFSRSIGSCFGATSYSDAASLPAFIDFETIEVTISNFGSVRARFELSCAPDAPVGGPFTGTITYTVYRGGSVCRERTFDLVIFTTPALPPEADFAGSPRAGVVPFTVSFTDSTRHGVTSRLWDFGDGSTSTLRDPQHTYTNPGNYTVSLDITGPAGTDFISKSDFVNGYECTGNNVYWTGGGDGASWGDPANWCSGALPGVNDHALIIFDEFITPGGDYTITLDSDVTVSSLTLGGDAGEQALEISGAALTVNNTLTVRERGKLTLLSGSIGGPGDILVQGYMSWSSGSVAGTGDFTVDGRLVLGTTGAHDLVNRSLLINPGGLLTLNGGTFSSDADIIGNGLVQWNGGTVSGSGALMVNDTLTLNGGNLTSMGKHLMNNQVTVWNSGNINLNGNAVFTNRPGARFEILLSSIYRIESADSGSFENQGELIKRAGYTTSIQVPFSNSGTVTADSSGAISFSGSGTYGGSLIAKPGGGLIFSGTIAATTHRFLPSVSITAEGSISFSNGKIINDSDLEIDGLLLWQNSVLSGSGALTVNDSLRILNSNSILEGKTFINQGHAVWEGGNIELNSGALFINQPGARFEIQVSSLYRIESADSGSFENQGELIKRAGYTTVIQVPFTNSGTVTADSSGAISFSENGTYGGNLIAKPGGSLIFSGTVAATTHRFLPSVSITAEGSISFSNGKIINDSDLEIDGLLLWQNSVLSGSGALTVNDSLRILNSNSILEGKTFINQGHAVWEGGNIELNSGALFINQPGARFEIQVSSLYRIESTDSGSFDNQGELIKRAGYTTVIQVPFTSSGTVTADSSGAISFSEGGSYGGSLIAKPGGSLVFSGTVAATTHRFLPSVSISAEGSISFNNGRIINDSDLEIDGLLLWQNSVLSGSGALTVNDSLRISGSNSILEGKTFINQGRAVWAGGNIALNSGAQFLNRPGARFDIQLPSIYYIESADSGSFENQGELIKRAGFTTSIQVPFSNSGTVTADSLGTISFQESGFYGGSLITKPGGSLIFSGTVATTTHRFLPALSLNAEGSISFSNGRIINDSDLEIDGLLLWQNSLLSGSGTLTVNDSLRISSSNSILEGKTFINQGHAVWTSGNIALNNGALFLNQIGAVFEILQNFNDIQTNGGGSFDNRGRLIKRAGFSTNIQAALSNSGTVQIDSSGTLRCAGDLTNQPGGDIRGYGTLNLSNANFSNQGAVSPGTSPGILTISGNYETTAGTLNIELDNSHNPGSGHDQLSVSGSSTLGGTLNLNVTDGYLPNAGDQFTILHSNSGLSGNFAAVNAPSWLTYQLQYGSNDVIVNVGTGSAPALLAPPNGAVNTALAPTLRWRSVASADSYHVQLATSPSFSNPIVDENGLSDTLFAVPALDHFTTYYWRVRSMNPVGPSPFSPAWQFTTIIAAPATPLLATPLNGAGGVPLNPTLRWHPAARAAAYRVQVAADSDFTALVIDSSGVADTAFVATNLDYHSAYFWRIGAANDGGTSPFSDAWQFTTTLPAPLLLSPPDGAGGLATALDLVWRSPIAVDSFQVQVANDPGFASLVVNSGGISDTVLSISGLAYDSTYYWRVRADDPAGGAPYSAAWSFSTIIAAPATPLLAAPLNGAGGVPVNPTLRWYPAASAASYRVQVAADSNFTMFVIDSSGVADTAFVAANLDYHSTYFWQISAANDGGSSPFSDAWQFTTIIAAPAAPLLAAPPNSATGIALDPSLHWHPADNADAYWVQLAVDSNFASLLVDSSGVTDTTLSVAGLDYETVYFWQVKALNAGGEGPFSDAWQFTTMPITGLDIFGDGLPKEFILYHNFPNPFNPATRIRYGLPRASEVRIEVFNITGQKVATLVDAPQPAGYYTVEFDAMRLASGIYFYRMQAEGFVRVQKMILLK